jgi:hypothetical protein
MSAGQRAQIVSPPMNKLRALTTRTALRLILGQSEGLDVSEVFTNTAASVRDLTLGVAVSG